MSPAKPPEDESKPALEEVLGMQQGARPWRRRALWLAALVAAVVIAIVALGRLRPGGNTVRYKTQPVTRGTLVVRVSATGNLQPTNQVEVGSELSGIVEKVFVDENDRVKKGQVLARLDLAKLHDAVAKSRASLAAADAQVLQAEATAAEAQAALARFKQVAELSGGKVPSRAEMDAAEANEKRAAANEASARASVVQARANLQSDRTNLEKASIRSPINGVVLKRAVEPGQTVAASFQVAVLFTLAEDLTKMELKVLIDEADVGQVTAGQRATFTVDAWPDRKYDATLTRVGYGAEEKEGVVSYPAVLEVRNDDLSLRPGMTGTAEITTLTHENAVLVPTAALRFTPPATDTTQRGGRGALGILMPRRPPQTRKPPPPARGALTRVWVLRGGQPEALEVTAGAGNGRLTEITSGPLEEGMQVITEARVEP